jgi:hypothetical protein
MLLSGDRQCGTRNTLSRLPRPALGSGNDEGPWLPVVSQRRHDRHADQAPDRVRRYVVAAVLPDRTSAGNRVIDRLRALKARHECASPKGPTMVFCEAQSATRLRR